MATEPHSGEEKASPDGILLNIRLIDANTFSVNINGEASIADLKELLAEIEPSLSGKKLRLIAFGRILEDTHTISEEKLVEGSFVHCVATSASPPVEETSPTIVQMNEDDEDVNDFELDFLERMISRGRRAPDSVVQVPSVLRTPYDVDDSESVSPITDFMMGFFIGFIFGWFSIICLMDRNVIRRHTKMGIAAGLLFSIGGTIGNYLFFSSDN